MLQGIILLMETLMQRRHFTKGDLVKFITVISGTSMDGLTGALGVVTEVKGGKLSLFICERHINNIPAGCVEHVEKSQGS